MIERFSVYKFIVRFRMNDFMTKTCYMKKSVLAISKFPSAFYCNTILSGWHHLVLPTRMMLRFLAHSRQRVILPVC